MKSKGYSVFRATAAGLVLSLGGLFVAQGVLACTLTLWNGGNIGGVVAGQPDTDTVARYAGLCAMQAPGGVVSYVQDNSPGGINRIVARFYVLNNLDPAQDAIVYRGFSTQTGTGNLFTVRLTTDGTVRLIDNATGTSISQGSSNPWASVEIDWTQGSPGSISLSVDGQTAVTQSVSNAGSALQSVRLGNLNSATGTLNFDAYESRRSTAIGRLVHPDPNGDGNPTGINSQDFAAMVDDFSGSGLATGTPDCNEDGEPLLNSQDFACIVDAFLNQ